MSVNVVFHLKFVKVFGNNPCNAFPKLTTEEFADRFLTTIKATASARSVYLKHLALLVSSSYLYHLAIVILYGCFLEKIC